VAEAGETDPADDFDVLPEDLDISRLAQLYEFPNNSKRRLPATLYLAVGAICLLLGIGVDSPKVNSGLVVFGVGLLAFALYSYAVAVPTKVDEGEALVVSARVAGFTVGPASAQMIWRGWRSRPAWRILMYSAEPQPLRRAIVVVDGVDGSVLEQLVEDNPEDWSEL
jgi:hypothetical protein